MPQNKRTLTTFFKIKSHFKFCQKQQLFLKTTKFKLIMSIQIKKASTQTKAAFFKKNKWTIARLLGGGVLEDKPGKSKKKAKSAAPATKGKTVEKAKAPVTKAAPAAKTTTTTKPVEKAKAPAKSKSKAPKAKATVSTENTADENK